MKNSYTITVHHHQTNRLLGYTVAHDGNLLADLERAMGGEENIAEVQEVEAAVIRHKPRRGPRSKQVMAIAVPEDATAFPCGQTFESTKMASARLGYSYDAVYQALHKARKESGADHAAVDGYQFQYYSVAAEEIPVAALEPAVAADPAPAPSREEKKPVEPRQRPLPAPDFLHPGEIEDFQKSLDSLEDIVETDSI